MRLIERKHLNGSYKFEYINNYIKYEWIKQSSQKAEIVRLQQK